MGLGGRCGFRAGTLRRGKHRTEVTEATEGVKRLGGEWVGRTLTASVREPRRRRKASHRGHRGHRGD
jgi:hypothetical protein